MPLGQARSKTARCSPVCASAKSKGQAAPQESLVLDPVVQRLQRLLLPRFASTIGRDGSRGQAAPRAAARPFQPAQCRRASSSQCGGSSRRASSASGPPGSRGSSRSSTAPGPSGIHCEASAPGMPLLDLREILLRQPVADVEVGVLGQEAEVGQRIHFRPLVACACRAGPWGRCGALPAGSSCPAGWP